MLLTIQHITTYTYDPPVPGGLQQLRLTPLSSEYQTVLEWSTTVVGGQKQVAFTDQHGNHTELVSFLPDVDRLEVTSSGTVETTEAHGMLGYASGYAPLWLFRRRTPLTTPGPQLTALAESVDPAPDALDGQPIEVLHRLAGAITDAVVYTTGSSNVSDSAEEVVVQGMGVCQDHAHVLVAAARHLGCAARYVSGYLHMGEQETQDASHAWAEVWVPDLGWVGFDPSNAISPDERYVRVATGLDYSEAAPISGMRYGGGDESLDVTLQIQQ